MDVLSTNVNPEVNSNRPLCLTVLLHCKESFLHHTIELLRDAFHIGLIIGPRPAVLA
jgi:hypothetical protein